MDYAAAELYICRIRIHDRVSKTYCQLLSDDDVRGE